MEMKNRSVRASVWYDPLSVWIMGILLAAIACGTIFYFLDAKAAPAETVALRFPGDAADAGNVSAGSGSAPEVENQVDPATPVAVSDSVWVDPVSGGVLSALLGSAYGGENICDASHQGIDILVERAPVGAARNGIIFVMQYDPAYGNEIYIRHPDGLISYYWHLESWDADLYAAWLASGEVRVLAGQRIGISGSVSGSGKYHLPGEADPSGDTAGEALLHFGIYEPGVEYLDPLDFLPGEYDRGYCYLQGCTPCGNPACCVAPPDIRKQPPATPTATLTPSGTPTVTPTPTQTYTRTLTPTLTLTLSAGLQTSCLAAGTRQTALVTDVVDGDTIEVLLGAAPYTVEYAGVNAPEYDGTHEYYGQEAWLMNQELVLNKTVLLVGDSLPVNGSVLYRYVVAGDVFVNEYLVKNGFARLDSSSAGGSCLQQIEDAQEFARFGLLGLWKPTPMPLPTSTRPAPTSTPVPPTPRPACDPSYPDFCIPPPPPDLNCGDIGVTDFTVYEPDPHDLDGNNNGRGCE